MMNKNNENGQRSKYLICAILSFICFICFSYNIIAHLNTKSSTDTKKEEHAIKGCYYITDSLTGKKDLTTTLCVNEDNTDFNYKNSGAVTLYNSWVLDSSLDIQNSYGETLFYCHFNREDNNKMKCTSYNKALGSGTWVWEK